MNKIELAAMVASGLAEIIKAVAKALGASNEEIAIEVARQLRKEMDTDAAWAEFERLRSPQS
jgi:hypothetical protein